MNTVLRKRLLNSGFPLIANMADEQLRALKDIMLGNPIGGPRRYVYAYATGEDHVIYWDDDLVQLREICDFEDSGIHKYELGAEVQR